MIKIYPELGRLANLKHKFPVYKVWAIARSARRNRAGHISSERFVCRVAAVTQMTHNHIYQLIKKGDGVAWEVSDDGEVYFYSHSRFAQSLGGLEAEYDYRMEVPLEDFARWTKSVVLAAWLTHHKHPIAYKTIGDLFGVTRKTAIKWMKHAPVIKTPNYAIMLSPTDDGEIAAFKESHSWYKCLSCGYKHQDLETILTHVREGHGGNVHEEVAHERQLPNSYETSYDRGKRVREPKGKAMASHAYSEVESPGNGGQSSPRLYCYTRTSAGNALSSAGLCYQYTTPGRYYFRYNK